MVEDVIDIPWPERLNSSIPKEGPGGGIVKLLKDDYWVGLEFCVLSRIFPNFGEFYEKVVGLIPLIDN